MRPQSKQQLSKKRRWDAAGVLLDESAAARALTPSRLAEIFGRRRPVELEIGVGKGTFLLARAAARCEHNFLGVEYARAYCEYAADRARRAGLTNVRLLHAEAAGLFSTALADGCLWRVYALFPDPWPKRRHHRRRLIQPPFAAEIVRTLGAGGLLVVVTDHLDYARQIESVLGAAHGLARTAFRGMSDAAGELVGTNFERKYIRQGRRFYPAAWLRYVEPGSAWA